MLDAPVEEALKLQRPLPEEALKLVAVREPDGSAQTQLSFADLGP